MNTQTTKHKYNSAVSAKNIDFNVFEGIYKSGNLTAFMHDLNKGVHPEFLNAEYGHVMCPNCGTTVLYKK